MDVLHRRPMKRDPNAFYYKPSRPKVPSSQFSVECEQWRHGETADFEAELSSDKNQGAITGSLECRFRAENLSEIIVLRMPVRISIRDVSAYDAASALVDALVSK
jgi:hypothetical protein